MKCIIIAAGTLFLGTSALAWAPSTAPAAQGSKVPIAATARSAKAPGVTLVAKSNVLPKIDEASAKFQTASVDRSDKVVEADPDLDLAVNPDAGKADYAAAGIGVSEETLAANERPATDETLAAEMGEGTAPASSAYTGTGGPLEEVAYPPCRPGPGDDRCIQLYEPGVTGN